MPTQIGTRFWRPYLAVLIVFSIRAILLPGVAISQNVIFEADFENTSGDNNWTFLGGASDGNWLIGTPTQYYTQGFLMERPAFQGTQDLLTGQNFGQDVDGGTTRANSKDIALPVGSVILEFDYYFAFNTSSSSSDYFYFELRRASDNALLRRITRENGSASGKPAAWTHVTEDISSFGGENVFLRVRCRDGSGGSKVEAAVDLVRITASTATSIEGTVYEDLDVNGVLGVNEVGIAGVTATLFQAGTQIQQTTTDTLGYYEFTGLTTGDDYQLVFSGWSNGVSESVIGPDNKGSVQNVSVGDGFSHLGLYTLNLQCSENPFLVLPCYVEGPYASIANEASIVKLRASAEGHDFLGTNYTTDYEADAVADYGTVGTVYGIAWQGDHQVYYASAFHKRYTSFGPQGPDAIYQMDINGNLLGHISLDALLGVNTSAGADVHDLSPNGAGHVYDLGGNNASFDGVGKRSFGDIEISSSYDTLYVVNLFDRKIYALDVSTGQTSGTTILTSWDAPDQSGSGRHRPFGLSWHDGQLWVGSVDENGQTGWVHSLDVQTGSFTLELTIPLQFDRQAFFGNADNSAAPNEWNPWQSDPNFSYHNVSNEIAYPQPIISDIEFASNGDMIIGFRDRFGDQSGAGKYFNTSDNNLTWAISQGDILKACYSGGSFVLESGASGACPAVGSSSGNSGPNGQEFYFWDIYELEQNTWDPASNSGAFHWEVTQGGLVQLDSFDYVFTTALDPVDDFSGGIIKLNNTSGEREGVVAPTTTDNVVGGYTIFEGGDYAGGLPPNNGFAAKANGLGDIEAACFLPITIGNLVWFDEDGDGLQDETEVGLVNVLVEIFRNGVKIGETTTDTTGLYFFGGFSNQGLNFGEFLEPYSNYELRVNNSSALSNDGTITTIGGITTANVNANGNDIIDSDALSPGSYAFINLTTGQEGYTDYSFDFGYTSCGVVTYFNSFSGCSNDGYSVSVGSSVYNQSNPSGIDTLLTALGCDSIVITELVFGGEPVCEILSETDILCANSDLTLSAFTHYDVLPDSGLVNASSGVGLTLSHQIIGVQDPASVKVIITLPTWDDHFDTIALNGQMIIPKVVQPNSYNASGMNCQTPWIANVNGLPRSIIEITSTEVKYFSSLTPNSTSMTEVFPTNWTTTPQPFIVGQNDLQFGIQNTAGPVGGNWLVEARGTVGYTYLWSTGEAAQEITVSPEVTTTYQLTVTAPSGCESVCDKTIVVDTLQAIEKINYSGCSGDGYSIEVNNVIYNESNPTDTINLLTQTGCDSIIIIDLLFYPEVYVEAGMTASPICSNDVLALSSVSASITGGETTGTWTSIGGGTFDNNGLFGNANPATTYTPSTQEIDQGIIILTLTSNDPPGPCEPQADAVMIIINDIRCSQFPWAGGQN